MTNTVELSKWCLERAMELESTTEGVLIAAGQIRNFVLPTPLVEEHEATEKTVKSLFTPKSGHITDAIAYHQGIQVDSNSPNPIVKPGTESPTFDIKPGAIAKHTGFTKAPAPEPEECINEAAKVVESAKKEKLKPIFPAGATLKVHNAIVETYLDNKEPRAKQVSEMVGFKSTATAHHHIKKLEERGFIKKDKRSFTDVVLIPIKTADGERVPTRFTVGEKKTEDISDKRIEANEASVLCRIIAASTNDVPITPETIAHDWRASASSVRHIFRRLIGKGFIKLKQDVDSGCEWEVLKDVKGQPYSKPEETYVDGVKVTRYPTAVARGFLPFSSKMRGGEV